MILQHKEHSENYSDHEQLQRDAEHNYGYPTLVLQFDVSDVREANGKLVTYHGGALLRELCPWRFGVAPQSEHQHRRDCHE